MDQTQYRQQSGEEVEDAALQDNLEEETEELEDELDSDELEDSDEEQADDEAEETDELPELSPKEKTAFEKRRERDLKKAEEKLRETLAQEYEAKYGKHKAIVDLLGGDPETVEKAIRENQMAQEADQLAKANGWDEAQTQAHLNQMKLQQELFDLRVDNQINDLRDNADYAGIKDMKADIKTLIRQSNNTLTVQQAYLALGGTQRLAQIKRETEQREIAKRSQAKRTVQSDSPTSNAGPKPLSPELMKQANALGISVEEARRLMSSDRPQNLSQWREKRKAK